VDVDGLMPTFTVQTVEQAASGGEGEKAWTRQKLTVLAAGDVTPQVVTLFCNKWQPVPAAGSTIEGDIQPPKQEGWTPELKPPRKGGGGSKDFRADPVKQAAIAMEVALKEAREIMVFAASHGQYAPPAMVAEIVDQQLVIAEKYFARIMEKSEAAK